MPLFSVIIPVYNASLYIEKCIKSLQSQSFSDFEIIAVNDGSKDNSYELLKSFSEKDNRIKVLNQQNQGVSATRNNGIKEATGEWIVFVDSDDWVSSHYLQVFADCISTNIEIDMLFQDIHVVRNGEKFDSEMENYFKYHELPQNKPFKPKEILSITDITKIGQPFAKAFKREIIKKFDLKFSPKYSMSEDFLFIVTYFNHIKYLYATNAKNYFYALNDNVTSLSKNGYDYNLFKDVYFEIITEILKFSDDLENHNYYSTIQTRLFNLIFYGYKNGLLKLPMDKRILFIKEIRENKKFARFFTKYYQQKTSFIHYMRGKLLFNRHYILFDSIYRLKK